MRKPTNEPDNTRAALEALLLGAKGWRTTSRRHGLIARIDRPDWRMRTRLAVPDADYYRRCESAARMQVTANVARFMTIHQLGEPGDYIE